MSKKKRNKKNKASRQHSKAEKRPKADAAASAKADSKSDAGKDADSESDSAESGKAEIQPEPTAGEHTEPKADKKPEPKADKKPEPKADKKPEPKAETKPEPKAETKPEAKESPATAKSLPVLDSGPAYELLEFSPETMAEFEKMVVRYPERRGALLPTLRLIERDFGNISDAGMAYAAKLIGVSPAYVLGVVTFYTHYRRPSDGKYVIELCRTLPCALRGSDLLAEHACKKLGINMGETTADGKITIKSVECIAACGYAPALQLNGCYHEKLTPEIFDQIVDGLE